MPKFGAHILIAEIAQQRRPQNYEGVINALRLGAVGPDLTLFLFDSVKNKIARKGYDTVVFILTEIKKIKKKFEHFERIFNNSKENDPSEDLVNWVTGHMVNDFSETAELLVELILLTLKLGMANVMNNINIQNPLFGALALGQLPLELIKNPAHRAPNFLIDTHDNYGFPFRAFGHPLTEDGTWRQPTPTGVYTEWWWMDMLHYRKTGEFAKALLNNATDKVTLDYARGYLSHVAGDICGHPFINGLVGGPFRNHAYRHMVLESLADTKIWHTQNKGDIISSGLHDLIAVSDKEIASIANLLIRSMKQVYKEPFLPKQFPKGYPAHSDIMMAYKAMSIYLELSTTGKVERPKPPPSSPEGLLKEIQELLSRNNPGSLPIWRASEPLDSIIAVLGWFFRGVIFLLMIATLPHALLMRFLTTAQRWLLYLIKSAIFTAISGLRTMLALMGWGYAGIDDFDTFGFLTDMVTFNGIEGEYPRANFPDKKPYYWITSPVYNNAPVEYDPTLVGSMPRGTTLDWILDPNNKYDPLYSKKLVEAINPRSTIDIEQLIVHTGGQAFGNAPDFCNLMLNGDIPIPDLDLDGDRGFGFKPWEILPPKERYL